MGATILIMVTVLSAFWTGQVWGLAQSGESVSVDKPLAEDLYAAGTHVRISARVAGDVTVAGMSVSIEAVVEDDVNAAGEHVSIRSPIADDLRAAGRRIDIEADVGDHVVAAGEIVRIAPGATIGSFAWLAGREVRVEGRIGQELRVAAERVIIGGEVAGDVEIMAEAIEVLPNARLQGNLTWHSTAEPAISPEAVVEGQVIAKPLPERGRHRPSMAFGIVFIALVLLVTGAVLFRMFPRCFIAAASATRSGPWKSIGLGLAVLAATPLVAVLLFATGIGWLLGLLVLLIYVASLPFAWFVAAFTLGAFTVPKARSEHRGRHSWLALLGGVVALALVQLVPVLGGVIAILALCVGLGGLALGCYGRASAAPAS